MTKTNDRRRVIKLMAASIGASMGASISSRAAMALAADEMTVLHQWHGFALGAEVSMQVYHSDKQIAQRVIENSVQIIRRMEALFSLYQPNSQISILNRQGVVNDPAVEFVDLLRKAHHISQITSGAFDITVQPLWLFYEAQKYDENFVLDGELEAIQKRIGYKKISIYDDKIYFKNKGMLATLNGIAQGYITDRVSEYLKTEGMTSVLVDIGEFRALGAQVDKSPWRIGLADPHNFGELSDILEIYEGAVATSSGTDDTFDDSGEFHHLFNPKTGKSSHKYSSVTVMAPDATLADALSTAFCSLSVVEIKSIIRNRPLINVRLTDEYGAVVIV